MEESSLNTARLIQLREEERSRWREVYNEHFPKWNALYSYLFLNREPDGLDEAQKEWIKTTATKIDQNRQRNTLRALVELLAKEDITKYDFTNDDRVRFKNLIKNPDVSRISFPLTFGPNEYYGFYLLGDRINDDTTGPQVMKFNSILRTPLQKAIERESQAKKAKEVVVITVNSDKKKAESQQTLEAALTTRSQKRRTAKINSQETWKEAIKAFG